MYCYIAVNSHHAVDAALATRWEATEDISRLIHTILSVQKLNHLRLQTVQVCSSAHFHSIYSLKTPSSSCFSGEGHLASYCKSVLEAACGTDIMIKPTQ